MRKFIVGIVLSLTAVLITSCAQNEVKTKTIEEGQISNTEMSLLKDGIKAFLNKDYKKAFDIFQNEIPNNAKAQGFIGIMYLHGMGVKQDFKEARKWLDKSANQGDMDSLNIIASLYAEGISVEQDYKKAIELYEKSANTGNISAKDSIAYLYATGKGVEKDLRKAYIYWIEASKSGKEGNPTTIRAKNSLRILCENNPEVCK
ncbi:tetratricopeptide repeat protein [Aliarcobacter butzleri]|uniref:tetratricopeptide repeat protein n=1 Tax=Aliarcobacter butzleri TaxID=28197 RepID=UPI00263F0498|nr:tetratricopeptide repeat protein [Aliarcobacter butzleri]MDN5100569.1 tetratricopeptide repeat protein [Aliarcobacter butzleri]